MVINEDRGDLISRNAHLNDLERKQGLLILESKPRVLFVELSRRCNLSCPMCHRWTLPRSSYIDMSKPLIEWLENELFPTAQFVDLHGLGESTLHPDFPMLVRRISALGARVRLVSNLNELSSEARTALVETDAYICFSLGALGQSAYQRIYAKGNFGHITSNLRKLHQLRKVTGTCKDMSCLTMLSSENISALPDLMRFLVEHGVNHQRIFPMYLKPGDSRYIGNHLGVWNEIVEQAFGLADQLGMELRVVDWPVKPGNSVKTLSNYVCHRPWTHIHVNVDGKIGLCDYNEHDETLSALVVGKGDFCDIWNSHIYQSIRREFLNKTPSKASRFCGDVCRYTKFVDFDDMILPELANRVLSNRSPLL